MRMADEYGPIFRLTVPGGTRLIVSGARPGRRDLRRHTVRQDGRRRPVEPAQGSRGLGPVHGGHVDPLWHRAHNILMSPFSLQAMRDYVPRMIDIAEQLMDKWEPAQPG